MSQPTMRAGEAHRPQPVHTGPVLSWWDPVRRHCELVFVGPDDRFDGEAAAALIELLHSRVGSSPQEPYTVLVDLHGIGPGTAAWRHPLARELMAQRRQLRLVGYHATGVPLAVATLFLRATGLEAQLFPTEREARAWLAAR